MWEKGERRFRYFSSGSKKGLREPFGRQTHLWFTFHMSRIKMPFRAAPIGRYMQEMNPNGGHEVEHGRHSVEMTSWCT